MTIQEILEAHLRVMGQRGTGVLCICGWHTVALGKRSEDLHRAHVAEVLDKHMQEARAQELADMTLVMTDTKIGYQNQGQQMVIRRCRQLLREQANQLRKDTTNGR